MLEAAVYGEPDAVKAQLLRATRILQRVTKGIVLGRAGCNRAEINERQRFTGEHSASAGGM